MAFGRLQQEHSCGLSCRRNAYWICVRRHTLNFGSRDPLLLRAVRKRRVIH
jgi:hypothetical protein